ncbi:inward rectifier potassium channel 2 [Elysia marginata]|uniref:Inward rectifier potassium channel 2 n=1 Tax=Elysia marginata TaxID=1093978 RepID=A0AAV4JDK9_9GAST|nr:inward rectifier potassium channel 2 [Elysia marginata]
MSLRRRFRLDGSGVSTKRRLMHVTGHNIVTKGVPDRNRKYMSDLYTTLIDIKWRWNILIFTLGFVLTWLAFGCLYFLLTYLHGDLVDARDQPPDFVPCLDNVHSFTAAYLFSIETMTTIGYGYRGQTHECPGVYLTVMIQSILGAGLQFALASIVVSKTRKAKRDEMLSDQYELIVVIDGVSGATSQPFQARKSYHASEMRWGHRFSPIDLQFSRSGSYVMDLANFHQTVPACTPLCSAQDITTLRKIYQADDGENIEASVQNEAVQNEEIPQRTHHPSERASSANNIVSIIESESLKSERKSAFSKDPITTVSRAYRKAVRSRRSVSLVENCMMTSSSPHILRENPNDIELEKQRRCSLGDLIRVSQGVKDTSSDSNLPLNISDALNIYRHRRSITDTYLGEEIDEEVEGSEDSSSQAILTIMSHVSSEEHVDVRDVFKKRKTSASQLYFSPETGDSEDEISAKEPNKSV